MGAYHQEQLRQHQLAVDAVIEQQQRQQPQQQQPVQHLQQQPVQHQQQQPVQQQHRFQPQRQQPANAQVRENSHFSIPGQHRHRQFADELKLAQEALKVLG